MDCPNTFMEKEDHDSDNIVRPVVAFAAFGPRAFSISAPFWQYQKFTG